MPIYHYVTVEATPLGRVFGPYPDAAAAMDAGRVLASEFHDPDADGPPHACVLVATADLRESSAPAGTFPPAVYERLDHRGPFRIRQLVDGAEVIVGEYDTPAQAKAAEIANRRRTTPDRRDR